METKQRRYNLTYRLVMILISGMLSGAMVSMSITSQNAITMNAGIAFAIAGVVFIMSIIIGE